LNKPILENDSINFINLYNFLWNTLKKYSRFFLYASILFIVYFSFFKTPSYSSQVSFYANYSESEKLSSLGFIATLGIGSTEGGDLGFSISNYLDSEKFLQNIVEKKYNIGESEKTLVDYWGNNYNKVFSINPISMIKKLNRKLMLNKNASSEDKKLLFAKEVLSESIFYSEDRKSSLHQVKVVTEKYPNLSEQIVSEIYQSIIDYSTEVTNIKAREKRSFIEGRLTEIKRDLEQNENELLLFLEKNKNLSSPSLILQKDRIERNIRLYSELYLSLSDQLEIAKIDEKDTTSSIFLLDSPNTSSYKSGMTLSEGILYVVIILFFLFLSLEIYHNNRKLFI